MMKNYIGHISARRTKAKNYLEGIYESSDNQKLAEWIFAEYGVSLPNLDSVIELLEADRDRGGRLLRDHRALALASHKNGDYTTAKMHVEIICARVQQVKNADALAKQKRGLDLGSPKGGAATAAKAAERKAVVRDALRAEIESDPKKEEWTHSRMAEHLIKTGKVANIQTGTLQKHLADIRAEQIA